MSELEPIYRAVGRRICAERRKRGLNQDTLAAGCGLTRASFANIEAGRQRVQLHALAQIADVLGVPVGDLLTEQPAADLEAGIPAWVSEAGKASILTMVETWRNG